MGERDDSHRLIAACTTCGAVFAAREIADGNVLPIGTRKECTSCGGTTFERLSLFSSQEDGTGDG